MGKVVPERPQGAMKMQLLPAGLAKGAGHLCPAIEAGALARMPLTGLWFHSTGQQPARHHIAHSLNITRHGMSIAAGPVLVIVFAF